MIPRFTCPRCGQHAVVPVLYGYPSDEAFAAADRGEIALGGCDIGDGTPRDVRCRACDWDGIADESGTTVGPHPRAPL